LDAPRSAGSTGPGGSGEATSPRHPEASDVSEATDRYYHLKKSRGSHAAGDESRTGSIQYVVSDPITGRSAIIDPVLDFNEKSGATAARSADKILDYVHENGLSILIRMPTTFRRQGMFLKRPGRRPASASMSSAFRRSGNESTIGRPFELTDRNGTGSSKMASGSASANSMPR
jgi:hypothetical protein